MQTVPEASTAPDNCHRAVRPGGFGEVTVTPTNTPMTILGAIAA